MEQIIADRILFVDDEENVLNALKRQLHKSFNVSTALGGELGLDIIKKEGPFAVVISDMRMPGMDGVHFLSKVKAEHPNIIRIMLTGHADMDIAISAVNEGNIFRFMMKPCLEDSMIKVLNAALNQYHLQMAEKELLEKTLNGSIKVLVDILSLINPTVFSHTTRIKYFVMQITNLLNLPNSWMYEVAAMLSQIGCVTIPAEILEKKYNNEKITEDEIKMLNAHPAIGGGLISNIPRLESVAKIIVHQLENYSKNEKSNNLQQLDPVIIGSEILKVAIDFENMFSCGYSKEKIIEHFKTSSINYNPNILAILNKIEIPSIEKKIIKIKISELTKGMILEENVKNNKGVLLASKGQEVTNTMRTMFDNYYKQGSMEGTILISI